MNTKTIVRVNNVDILATSDEQLIAIRPICEALGIDEEGQRQRICRDEILSSVACMIKATGRDGKQYDMYWNATKPFTDTLPSRRLFLPRSSG